MVYLAAFEGPQRKGLHPNDHTIEQTNCPRAMSDAGLSLVYSFVLNPLENYVSKQLLNKCLPWRLGVSVVLKLLIPVSIMVVLEKPKISSVFLASSVKQT